MPSVRKTEEELVRLRARPRLNVMQPLEPGIHPIGLGAGRDGLISVPSSHRPGEPAALLVLLHGAGATAAHLLPHFQEQVDAAGLLVLAPDSRGSTWDMLLGDWGPDVAFLERALERVFSTCVVRPDRIAIGGFSDGASYALSLGLANGDLFEHILAFSPGFAAPPVQHGEPRIFISHGTRDRVLPIDRCSRPLRPRLERAGYEVLYREFDGEHVVPPAIMADAFGWWLRDGRSETQPGA
jgi:phospholipase/carboxylesterase